MNAETKKKNLLWPNVSTADGARLAVRGGVYAASIVAVLSAGSALYSVFESSLLDTSTAWAFADAVLFAGVAFGIWRNSRVAASAGLAWYVILQGYQWSATSGPRNVVPVLFLIWLLIGGVRGTFSYHNLARKPVSDTADHA